MKVSIRQIKDLPTLMLWRREVIGEVFGMHADAALCDANMRYYTTHISDGTHLAFIAGTDDADCGCGAICLTQELPSPDNKSGRCAYLMNIYVRARFRNHGIGHLIVRHLIDIARQCGCGKIYLETTDAGRSIYRSLGFTDMPDMMKLR